MPFFLTSLLSLLLSPSLSLSPQMVSMKLRKPRATASIWSSGKIMLTGPTSEEQARQASRRVARLLQKMGFKVKFMRFRIVNVLGIVNLPFGIRIDNFTEQHRSVCRYDPTRTTRGHRQHAITFLLVTRDLS